LLQRPRPTGSSGFTMIEMATALSIAAIVMVIVGNILISSTHSVDYVMTDTTADQEMKRGISRLLGDLRTASPSVVTIATSDADHDSIAFQTPGTYDGSVTWGAKAPNGAWQAGWSLRYTVVAGTLVRRVLDAGGVQVGSDELLVRGVDRRTSGRKGFALAINGPLVTATVRTRKTFRDSNDYSKEFSSSVFLENP
jgi:prepilin-type N-terminal cleavage/methylation domain-containing protein